VSGMSPVVLFHVLQELRITTVSCVTLFGSPCLKSIFRIGWPRLMSALTRPSASQHTWSFGNPPHSHSSVVTNHFQSALPPRPLLHTQPTNVLDKNKNNASTDVLTHPPTSHPRPASPPIPTRLTQSHANLTRPTCPHPLHASPPTIRTCSQPTSDAFAHVAMCLTQSPFSTQSLTLSPSD